jgi:GNAT superfamily N-acetyltransferase
MLLLLLLLPRGLPGGRGSAPGPDVLPPSNNLDVVIIRQAAEQDWPRIYPFFADIVAAGRTYAYPEDLSLEAARGWWMERPPVRTVVAVDGDAVLGSAKMGPNRPGRGSHVATGSFMVDPRHSGHGVGRALGGYLLDWAHTTGYRSIQFNAVVETNTAAVHLWQALGFRILATVPEAFDHPEYGLVGLHVMFRQLG